MPRHRQRSEDERNATSTKDCPMGTFLFGCYLVKNDNLFFKHFAAEKQRARRSARPMRSVSIATEISTCSPSLSVLGL